MRNNLNSLSIGLDTVENGCDFSGCDSLEYLTLATSKWKSTETDTFRFPATLKSLRIFGIHFNLRDIIQNTIAPNLQELVIDDTCLDNIPDNIRKFNHLRVLNIGEGCRTKLGQEIVAGKPDALMKLKKLKQLLPRKCEIKYQTIVMSCV